MPTQSTYRGEAGISIQYETPASGATVQAASDRDVYLVLDPAGLLAALTVTFPANPQDGDMLRVSSSKVVTLLTMNGGTILGSLSALAIGGFGAWMYNAASGKWFRFG